jgi:ferritin-like metal-binding protein YciE
MKKKTKEILNHWLEARNSTEKKILANTLQVMYKDMPSEEIEEVKQLLKPHVENCKTTSESIERIILKLSLIPA